MGLFLLEPEQREGGRLAPAPPHRGSPAGDLAPEPQSYLELYIRGNVAVSVTAPSPPPLQEAGSHQEEMQNLNDPSKKSIILSLSARKDAVEYYHLGTLAKNHPRLGGSPRGQDELGLLPRAPVSGSMLGRGRLEGCTELPPYQKVSPTDPHCSHSPLGLRVPQKQA